MEATSTTARSSTHLLLPSLLRLLLLLQDGVSVSAAVRLLMLLLEGLSVPAGGVGATAAVSAAS
jgi:hypothetical protein